MSESMKKISLDQIRKEQLSLWLKRIFGDFTADIFDEFYAHVTWTSLTGGQELAIDDGYHSLIHGRLTEYNKAGETIRELSQGEVIGGASVRGKYGSKIIAMRDCELIGISNKNNLGLLSKYPRYLAAFLQILQQPVETEEKLDALVARTIAIIPLQKGADAENFVRKIAKVIESSATVLVIDAAMAAQATDTKNIGDPTDDEKRRLSWWMDQQERNFRYVFYLTDVEADFWARLCIRNADRIALVANSQKPHDLTPLEQDSLRTYPKERKALILMHNQRDAVPNKTKLWLSERAVQHHFHVRIAVKTDVERIARFLTGKAIALVLGGGAARGFAHFGVLRAFEELGIPIDIIGGASAGTSIAASYVAGWSLDRIMTDVPTVFQKAFAPTRVAVPVQSILSTGNYDRMVWKYVPNIDIEDLPIPFFAVASRLKTAKPYVFRSGPLPLAVAASGRVPGLLAPLPLDDDYLVDGGLLDNLPVDPARAISKYATIVAVDVAGSLLDVDSEAEDSSKGWLGKAFKYVPDPKLNIFTILRRIAVLGSIRYVQESLTRTGTDLYLVPPVDNIPLGNFSHKNARRAAEIGYAYAKPILEKWWKEKGRQ